LNLANARAGPGDHVRLRRCHFPRRPWEGFACNCVGGCATTATFALEERAGNPMTHSAPTSSTSAEAAFVSVTAVAMNEGEALAYDVTNSPTSA